MDMLRQAMLDMIKSLPGSWQAAFQGLGLKSQAALENRVYERQGQSMRTSLCLALQSLSKSTRYAEAIAQLSGGVFIRLPQMTEVGSDDLLEKFNSLYAELGRLSAVFREAVKDNEVNSTERADLTQTGQRIHRIVEELLGLTFMVYCRDAGPVVGSFYPAELSQISEV